MIKKFEQYTSNIMNKLWYITTGDLGNLADKWISDNPHNNGYAVKWEVTDPESSLYPDIERFLISNGVSIGDEVIVHSVW